MNFVDGINEIYIDDLNMSSYSNAFAVADTNLQSQITALSNNLHSADVLLSNSIVSLSNVTSATDVILGNSIVSLSNELIDYVDTVTSSNLKVINYNSNLSYNYSNLTITSDYPNIWYPLDMDFNDFGSSECNISINDAAYMTGTGLNFSLTNDSYLGSNQSVLQFDGSTNYRLPLNLARYGEHWVSLWVDASSADNISTVLNPVFSCTFDRVAGPPTLAISCYSNNKLCGANNSATPNVFTGYNSNLGFGNWNNIILDCYTTGTKYYGRFYVNGTVICTYGSTSYTDVTNSYIGTAKRYNVNLTSNVKIRDIRYFDRELDIYTDIPMILTEGPNVSLSPQTLTNYVPNLSPVQSADLIFNTRRSNLDGFDIDTSNNIMKISMYPTSVASSGVAPIYHSELLINSIVDDNYKPILYTNDKTKTISNESGHWHLDNINGYIKFTNKTGLTDDGLPIFDTYLSDNGTLPLIPYVTFYKYGSTTQSFMSSNVNINGNCIISNKLNVNNDTILNSNLNVSGALTAAGITTLSSNLIVSGTASVGSTLTAAGITTLSSNLIVSGTANVCSTLGVTGVTTLSSNLIVSGTANVGSTLGVTGVTTLSSNLIVSGTSTFSSNIVANSTVTCYKGLSSSNFDVNTPSLHLENGNSLYLGSRNTQIEFANTYNTYKSYISTTNTSLQADNSINFYTWGGGADNMSSALLNMSLRNGSVGIGTTNPSYPLDVTGTGRFASNLYVGTTGVDNNSIYLAGGYGDNVSTYSGITRRIWDGVESSEVILYSFNDASDRVKLLGGMVHFDTYTSATSTVTGGITRMAIDSGGNVGIGSTSPRAKLDIKRISSDSSSMIGLSIGNGDYSGNYLKAQMQWYYDDNTNSGWSHFLHTRHIGGGSTGNAIDFYTCDGTQNNTVASGVNHALTLASGYVGIGTSSPVDALHIHKPFATSGYYETAGITFTTNTGSYNWITGAITPYIAAGSGNSISNFPGGLEFKTSTAPNIGAISTSAIATRMVIDSQGYVGINKMNPGYQLDVSGTSRLTGTVYVGSGSGDVFQSFCANNTFNNYVGCSGYLGVNGATANSSYPLVVTGHVLADHYTTQGSTGGSGTVNTGTVNCGTLTCSALSYGGSSVVISGTAGLYITRGITGGLGTAAGTNQGPISYGRTYASAPTVIVSGEADGDFCCSVYSRSTTNFYVNWSVGGTAATKKISWIAIGV